MVTGYTNVYLRLRASDSNDKLFQLLGKGGAGNLVRAWKPRRWLPLLLLLQCELTMEEEQEWQLELLHKHAGGERSQKRGKFHNTPTMPRLQEVYSIRLCTCA